MKIEIQETFCSAVPALRLGCLMLSVEVESSQEALITHIRAVLEEARGTIKLSEVSQLPSIQATKDAYRKFGKDPSRYRPSAESLTRRILQGKDPYLVNNVVDVLNLISIKYGFSIGGYDADRIDGNISLDTGLSGEPYSAIGRGPLNIEYLPVFRDHQGAFGSPTSDSLRTMVTAHTTRFLMIILDFATHPLLETAMEDSVNLLQRFASAKVLDSWVVKTGARIT